MFEEVKSYSIGKIEDQDFLIKILFDEAEDMARIEYLMNNEVVFYQEFANPVDILENDLPKQSVTEGFFQWHKITFNGSDYIGNQ